VAQALAHIRCGGSLLPLADFYRRRTSAGVRQAGRRDAGLLLVDAISGLGAWNATPICGISTFRDRVAKSAHAGLRLAFVAVSDKAWSKIDKNASARTFFRPQKSPHAVANFRHALHPRTTLIKAYV